MEHNNKGNWVASKNGRPIATGGSLPKLYRQLNGIPALPSQRAIERSGKAKPHVWTSEKDVYSIDFVPFISIF